MNNEKKYIFFSVLAICGVFLMYGVFSNGNPSENDLSVAKDTPIRIGALGVAQASLNKAYDLDSAVNDADLVADITITSWIGEDTGDAMTTFFDAKVNVTFKGDSFENIVLLQTGNSETTLKDYPLFKMGDRMILFLKKAVGVDCDNPYWIIGEYTTVMDIQTVDNVPYVMDRLGVLTESVVANTYEKLDIEIAPVNEMTKDRLHRQMESFDPVLSKVEKVHNNVFFYDDIGKVLGILMKIIILTGLPFTTNLAVVIQI